MADYDCSITVCEPFFDLKNFEDLPIVEGTSNPTLIDEVTTSTGAVLLTELFIMASDSGA